MSDVLACEVEMQCADKCSPPHPCGAPAYHRVSFLCADGCGRATKVLLMCPSCASYVTELLPDGVVCRALDQPS